MLRRLSVVLAAVLLLAPGIRAQAPAQQAAGEPKTVWYFYTVKWGSQDEFLDLFQRNHYPILKEMEKAGLYLSVKTYVPENHGDGRPTGPSPSSSSSPPRVRHRQPKRRSSRSCFPTARSCRRKKSGASSCSWRTGTCR